MDRDKQYVIVVESTEYGIESVHGPYTFDRVNEAQTAIRDRLRDDGRIGNATAGIVKLTRPEAAADPMANSALAWHHELCAYRVTNRGRPCNCARRDEVAEQLMREVRPR